MGESVSVRISNRSFLFTLNIQINDDFANLHGSIAAIVNSFREPLLYFWTVLLLELANLHFASRYVK